jgi:hypothetical protein
MCLCSRGRVETEDILPAGVVEEILLRGADEVPQLVVSAFVSLLLGLFDCSPGGKHSRNRYLERVVGRRG